MSQRTAVILFALSAITIAAVASFARAEDFKDRFPAQPIQCPTAEPCKVLTLTAQEEKLLMQTNGILDTAAQARALDLGQFSVYLKTRIASAPAGEPQKPVDTPVK